MKMSSIFDTTSEPTVGAEVKSKLGSRSFLGNSDIQEDKSFDLPEHWDTKSPAQRKIFSRSNSGIKGFNLTKKLNEFFAEVVEELLTRGSGFVSGRTTYSPKTTRLDWGGYHRIPTHIISPWVIASGAMELMSFLYTKCNTKVFYKEDLSSVEAFMEGQDVNSTFSKHLIKFFDSCDVSLVEYKFSIVIELAGFLNTQMSDSESVTFTEALSSVFESDFEFVEKLMVDIKESAGFKNIKEVALLTTVEDGSPTPYSLLFDKALNYKPSSLLESFLMKLVICGAIDPGKDLSRFDLSKYYQAVVDSSTLINS